ncbi:MAG: type IV pilus secretin PilQ [Nitrospinota bacterium]|nr:type IV pilus secretin PilQ [Nitrospinota bacterium]
MSRKLVAICAALALAGCASGKPTAKNVDTQAPGGSVNILDVTASGDSERVDLVVSADGRIQFTAFKMSDPPRLIVDLTQAILPGSKQEMKVNIGPVVSVKPLYFESSNDSRLEIDLAEDVDYVVNDENPSEMMISVFRKGSEAAVQALAEAATTKEEVLDIEAPPVMEAAQEAPVMEAAQEAPVMQAAQEAPAMTEEGQIMEIPVEPMVEEIAAAPIEDENAILLAGPQAGAPLTLDNVEFKQYKGLSRVVVTMSHPNSAYMLLSREKMNRLTLDLPGAVMDKSDERLINVNVEDSKVSNVAVFQFSTGEKPMVKVVVNLSEASLYNVSSEGDKIFLDVGDEALVALAATPEESQLKAMKPVEDEFEFEEKKYEGARISLNFFKADIHNILRIIADVSNLNVITSGDVKADVTIKLKNVPWDRALEVILKNTGMDMIREGNIIRVATAKAVEAEKKREEALQRVEKDLEPLFTKIFEVNYESAGKMKANLDSIKSDRGKIEINERTNILIVKDTKKRIGEMARLIRALDKKEHQVLIEARIVEVTHSHAQELGIVWGGFWNGVSNQNFPNTIGVTGQSGSSPNQPAGGAAVNLGTSSTTGALGISLGHVNGVALLDAKLMAMENSGNGRIISMPKITTMNNKEATIESGREIPYQSAGENGATTTAFKKATLSLKVTPHITPDKNVRMTISVNKDEADFANRGGPDGAPPIITKQAQTEVLIMDGSTTVIGGLFKDTDNTAKKKVPGFGDIPLIGWLFRNSAINKTGEELLIFISPKIVD